MVRREGLKVLPRAVIDQGGASRVVEVDRRGAQDLAVLDVDEDRAAVGAVGVAHDAVAHVGAGLPGHRLEARQRLHEPDREFIRAVEADLEVLGRVDALEHVERRGQEALGDRRFLKNSVTSGLACRPLPDADLAAELDPAAFRHVPQAKLGDQVPFPEPCGVGGVDPRGRPHRLRDAPQQNRQIHVALLGRTIAGGGRTAPEPAGRLSWILRFATR